MATFYLLAQIPGFRDALRDRGAGEGRGPAARLPEPRQPRE